MSKQEKTTEGHPKIYQEPLGFGEQFSDHMYKCEYTSGVGWGDGEICQLENFSLNPASAVFHYGQEIFEGLKAYRNCEARINLFRPLDNMKRFNHSAQRMAMPRVDETIHIEALENLIRRDKQWVPVASGSSLYIRPTMIATSENIAMRASSRYTHFIMTGPVGRFFPGELVTFPLH